MDVAAFEDSDGEQETKRDSRPAAPVKGHGHASAKVMTMVDLDFKTRQEIAGELEDAWTGMDDGGDLGPPVQQQQPIYGTKAPQVTITTNPRGKSLSTGVDKRPLNLVPKAKSFVARPGADGKKQLKNNKTLGGKGRSKEAIIEAGMQLSGTARVPRRRQPPQGASIDDMGATLSSSSKTVAMVNRRAPSAPPAGRHQVSKAGDMWW